MSEEQIPIKVTEAASHTADFVPTYSLQRKEYILGIITLIISFLISRYEIFYRWGEGRILGGMDRDAGIYYWISQTFPYPLSAGHWFNTPAFYPYSQTLAYSDSFLFPALVINTFNFLGLEHYQAYNLCILLAHFLFGFFTASLAFRISGNRFGSLLAGIAAISSAPILLSRLGHPQLQFFFFIPLCLLILLNGIKSRPVKSGLILGLVVLCAFLSSVYISLFMAVTLTSVSIALFLQHPNFDFLRRLFVIASSGLVIFLAMGFYFLTPYLEVHHVFGGRKLYELFYLSATPLSYISAPAQSVFYSVTSQLSRAEFAFFPGIAALALSGYVMIMAVLHKRLRPYNYIFYSLTVLAVCIGIWSDSVATRVALSTLLWLLLLLIALIIYKVGSIERKQGSYHLSPRGLQLSIIFSALLSFVLSLGPLLLEKEFILSFSPASFFYTFFPGFASARAVGRFGLLFLSLSYLLIPFSLPTTLKNRSKRLLYSLFATVIIFENLPSSIAFEPQSNLNLQQELIEEKAKPNEVGIVLPMSSSLKSDGSIKSWSNFAYHNVQAMNGLANSPLQIVNGYSGIRTKFLTEFPGKLQSFPDSTALKTLEQIPNLRWIIFELSTFSEKEKVEFYSKIKRFSPILSLESKENETSALIHFNPITALSAEYTLRVPSYPPQRVELELRGHVSSQQQASLIIRELDHEEMQSIAKLEIPLNDEWQKYTIVMPEVAVTARPLRISFESDNIDLLSLRSRSSVPR